MQIKKFPEVTTEEERRELLCFLEERFGLSPSLFDEYVILKGSTNYWLFPKTEHLNLLKKLSPEAVGLIFLRKVSNYLKPTSTFLQRFGKYATKNIVELNEDQLKLLQSNYKIPISLPLEEGYVILRDENWILGCGLYVKGHLYSYLETKVLKTLLD